jgi:hypothetical protein
MLRDFFTYSRFTLFVALAISVIAAYYSIIGLTAIFAGAFLSIVIMGSVLEVAKVTTTVWLHMYWKRSGWVIKTYLTTAVIALAFLTSMGIFGYLSKAHIDQGIPTGDVAAQVALLDEKIKTERDNIETARKALQQMDSQVDQLLSRGTTEQNAERAVTIRRQQAKERTALQNDIAKSQNTIKELNEQRAPIASQLRQVEAEVGPIKYIAALIYDDNPDTTMLERAVRWVIILIVAVFDPLAIILILAANNSLKWEREDRIKKRKEDEPLYEKDDGALTLDQINQIKETVNQPEEPVNEPIEEKIVEQVYLKRPWVGKVPNISFPPQVYKPEVLPEVITEKQEEYESEKPDAWIADVGEKPTQEELTADATVIPEDDFKFKPVPLTVTQAEEVITENVTKLRPLFKSTDEYVNFDGKSMSMSALKGIRPDLIYPANKPWPNQINFGGKFPDESLSGDTFIRIDRVPHIVYKFNGAKWIVVDKQQNSTYLTNVNYIDYLIECLKNGSIDIEILTEVEREEIETRLAVDKKS